MEIVRTIAVVSPTLTITTLYIPWPQRHDNSHRLIDTQQKHALRGCVQVPVALQGRGGDQLLLYKAVPSGSKAHCASAGAMLPQGSLCQYGRLAAARPHRFYLGLELSFLLQAALVVNEVLYAAPAQLVLAQLLCQAFLDTLQLLQTRTDSSPNGGPESTRWRIKPPGVR